MYGRGYPSPSSSGLPVTPPSNSRSLPTYGTPGAPYLYPRDLPPSPQSPSTRLSHGGSNPPITPHMSYVPLPTVPGTPVAGPYGLMTPPTSPTKSRGLGGGSFNLHPCLTQAGAVHVHCHFGRSLQSIQFYGAPNPQVILSQSATDTNTTILSIMLPFGVEVHITNPTGVQVGDVFHQLQVELSKRATSRELAFFASAVRGNAPLSNATRRIDLVAATPYFAGLAMSGNSWCIQFR